MVTSSHTTGLEKTIHCITIGRLEVGGLVSLLKQQSHLITDRFKLKHITEHTHSLPTKKTLAIRDYFAFSCELKKQWRLIASQHVFLWSRQNRGRIAAITTGSRRAQQGILKYHYNFSLYLGCSWSDFQTVFSKMMEIHSWLQSSW